MQNRAGTADSVQCGSGMSHVIEAAPSGRGRCRACKRTIVRGALQLVEDAASAFSSRGTRQRLHLECALEASPAQLREALLADAGQVDGRASLLERLELTLRQAPDRELPFAERLEAASLCGACQEPIGPGALAIAVEGEGPPHLHLTCARRAGLGDLDEALIRTHSRGLAPLDLQLVAEVLHAES